MDEPFALEIRVGWGDCDPAKIAYTGRIPEWGLEAINAFWEDMLDGDGWYQMELDRGFGTPFVHLSFDFEKPITPRHRLICKVWPTRLGTTSIAYRVDGYQGGARCFTSRFVSVFIKAESFTKAPPPDEVRAMIVARIRPDDGSADAG